MDVVVVESPAKAKTINKYLGKNYTVLASYGHIRDLPAKDGSVAPDQDFEMLWEVAPKSQKRIKDIADALEGADRLFLATDPDREGEAISWHIQEVLQQRRILKNIDVKRVVFNEITKNAIQDAFSNPRDVNRELVEAYLARRALDYLVGFTLSPVLWRKLPGSKSAGRVQSVALRLICQRESEIETFKSKEYWTIDVGLKNGAGDPVLANLTHLEGKKLGKFDLPNEQVAQQAVTLLQQQDWYVASLEQKQVKRHPSPPFTTSTLQQEASRKLGFSATHTMRVAQRLYEGIDIGGETLGLITYMRTDGVQISQEAIGQLRRLIDHQFGQDYVPEKPRAYHSKAKNAQEAHEAIRPTDLFRKPQDLAGKVEADQLRLYELIWKRTVASQMASAVFDQVTAEIAAKSGQADLKAVGSVLRFKGFLALYQEDRDDQEDGDDKDRRLPPLKKDEALHRNDERQGGAIQPAQHFTQPPPRFTEASLVKKLEELGIGRPSTYASILQVLQDRNYVRLEKKRFTPEDRGRLVTTFLENYFRQYVEYNFTADLEQKLDHISDGSVDWKVVLREFWNAFSKTVEETSSLTITDVLNAINEALAPHFFPPDPERPGHDPRACPSCGPGSPNENSETPGQLNIKMGKFGGFIGCSNYPDCRYTRPLVAAGDGAETDALADGMGPKHLGDDPETGLPVTLRKGPYGFYIQLGPKDEENSAEDGDKTVKPTETAPADLAEGETATEGKKTKSKAKAKAKTDKPKRASLPKSTNPTDVDLDLALALLALPRLIGQHPEDGKNIYSGLGRFGPYIRHSTTYASLTADDDVLTVGLNRAVHLLAEKLSKTGRGGASSGKSLGEHPEDGKPVTLHSGRYGPYVKHGKINATLPKDSDPEQVSLEEALALIAAKAEKSGTTTKAKAAPKRTPKAKTTKSTTAAKPKTTRSRKKIASKEDSAKDTDS